MCARQQSNPRPKFDKTLLTLKNLESINIEYSSHLKDNMGGILSKPIKNQLIQRRGSPRFKVAVASMQGYRESMEDAHSVITTLPHHENSAFFGVFDGHSGYKASEYCAAHFHDFLDKYDTIDAKAITEATMAVDKSFMEEFSTADDGCTATYCVVHSNDNGPEFDILVGNVGDSRTFLLRKDGTYSVTKDHKPNDDAERERIVKAKGSVLMNRVNGDLALSRAIGDRKFKQGHDLPAEEQQVIALPDITELKATKDDVLFICCDGIFEAMSNTDVVEFLRARLQRNEDPAKMLSDLLHQVVVASKDNMTAMIVLFEDGTSYQTEKDELILGPYQRDDKPDFKKSYEDNLLRLGVTLEQALDALSKGGVLHVDTRHKIDVDTFMSKNAGGDPASNELKKCSNPTCNNIETAVGEFKTCGKCKSVFYCSRECQAKHWKAGHKIECKPK
jgi:serine/threonine protein phosphatase PrpC